MAQLSESSHDRLIWVCRLLRFVLFITALYVIRYLLGAQNRKLSEVLQDVRDTGQIRALREVRARFKMTGVNEV
jgi:hypothetical protein